MPPSVSSSQRPPTRRYLRSTGASSRESHQPTKRTMKDLTVEIPSSLPTFLRRREKDRYALREIASSLEEQSLEEGALEEWLTSPRMANRRSDRQRRDLFAASVTALRRSNLENYESPASQCLDVRSSISSPAAASGFRDLFQRDCLTRERHQRDVLRDEFQKRMRRSGVLPSEISTGSNVDGKNKKQQQQLQLQETASTNSSLVKKQLLRSTSDRPGRVQRPPAMIRFSSASDADTCQEESSPRRYSTYSKPPTSPRKKSVTTGEESLFMRLSRQVRLGRREVSHAFQKRTNRIILHVYDLISKETIMLLPFGCDFPIGKFFNALNSGLHSLGTGAYHVGVEVNGIEYAYGANNIEGSSGVFTCVPKCSPGYQFRTSIDLGEHELKRRGWVSVPKREKSLEGVKEFANGSCYRQVEAFVDGRTIIKEMAAEYKGKDYDLLRKNCCTFAMDVCRRLGVKEEEIPNWFRNLADAGAKTKEAALSTIEPIQYMLSTCDNGSAVNIVQSEGDCGFEVIAQGKNGASSEMEIVKVIEADDSSLWDGSTSPIGVRRTLSWTY